MIVTDVETSGVDSLKNSIISIGAVEFLNPQNTFYGECQIWSGAEINPEALKINGFTEEEIRNPNKKTLKEILLEFTDWIEPIKDKTLAGHNIGGLDIPFLLNSFERCGFPKKYSVEEGWGKRIVDLHTLVYSSLFGRLLPIPIRNGQSALNLNYCLKYVGLPKEPMPHNALTGAKMEAEALFRLIFRGRKLMEEFKEYEIPKDLLEYLDKNKKEEKKPIDLNYRLSLFLKNKD